MAAKKPARRKHSPQRTCVVCHETTDKRDLVRIVCAPEEGIRVDISGKRAGRGAYLCRKHTCWQAAANADLLARALKTHMTDADREHLLASAPPGIIRQGDV